jgi:tight adherence protein C
VEEFNEIISRIKDILLPGGNLLFPVLIGCLALGLYLATTGLIGFLWPPPTPILSDMELVQLELVEERAGFRRQLRRKYPVYKVPFLERNLRPLVEELGHVISRGFQQLGLGRPASQDLERNLDLVGTGETVAGFYGQRLASGLVLGIVGLVCHISGVIQLSLLTLLGLLVIGFYLPSLSLKRKVTRMREEALSQLPAFIDLLSINVQAGMGLENAIERVSRMGAGTLPGAVRRAFEEAQYRNILSENRHRQAARLALNGNANSNNPENLALVTVGMDEEAVFYKGSNRHSNRAGSSRNLTFQALGEMAERFQVPELDDVVATLETSDRQGVPVTEILQALAGLMREKKKARLIELGNRSLVKMLVPVAVFILPAFLLLLLTPALLQFLALSK